MASTVCRYLLDDGGSHHVGLPLGVLAFLVIYKLPITRWMMKMLPEAFTMFTSEVIDTLSWLPVSASEKFDAIELFSDESSVGTGYSPTVNTPHCKREKLSSIEVGPTALA